MVIEEADQRWERFDVQRFEVGQVLAELGELVDRHREGVGGGAEDGVEQRHVGRVLRVVAGGVVVTEDEVFEERHIAPTVMKTARF